MGSLLSKFVDDRKKNLWWDSHPYCASVSEGQSREAYLRGLVLVAFAASSTLSGECSRHIRQSGNALALSDKMVDAVTLRISNMSIEDQFAEFMRTAVDIQKSHGERLFLVEAMRTWATNSGSSADWRMFRDSFAELLGCRDIASEAVVFESVFLEDKKIDLLELSRIFTDDELIYLLDGKVEDAKSRLDEMRRNETESARREEWVRQSRDGHRKDLARVMEVVDVKDGSSKFSNKVCIEDSDISWLSDQVSHVAYENVSWQVELAMLAISVSRDVSVWRLLVLALIKFRDDSERFLEIKDALQRLYVRVKKEDYYNGDKNGKSLISLIDKYFRRDHEMGIVF